MIELHAAEVGTVVEGAVFAAEGHVDRLDEKRVHVRKDVVGGPCGHVPVRYPLRSRRVGLTFDSKSVKVIREIGPLQRPLARGGPGLVQCRVGTPVDRARHLA